MVSALNQNGLRVVMDVVYNHTAASGQDDKSVLDKVVPGYYYRYDRRRRALHLLVLRRHRHRVRHDGEADDRHGGALRRRLQGGRLPLRSDEPAHPAEHAQPQERGAGAHRWRQRRGWREDLPLRRGLGLRLGAGKGLDHLPQLLRRASTT
ncbi:MAG: hypothetical protein V9H69_11175 [Anaerolineae bacterium]